MSAIAAYRRFVESIRDRNDCIDPDEGADDWSHASREELDAHVDSGMDTCVHCEAIQVLLNAKE